MVCSGDGTLSAFDLRQKRLEQRSDPSESELLSLAIVKVCVLWACTCAYKYVHAYCVGILSKQSRMSYAQVHSITESLGLKGQY